MDNSNRHHHLGVNKLGKAIKKDHSTATSSASSSSSSAAATAVNNNSGHLGTSFPAQPATRPSQQPPVYNISKSDFRAFVQQLTGAAGTSCVLAPRPPTHPEYPRTAAGNRLEQVRPPPLAPIARPARAVADPPALPRFVPAESPVSAYLRYLESSLLHSDGSRGVGNPAVSSQASAPSVPPPASPLGFPSPRSLLNLPSPNPLLLSPPGTSSLHPPLSPGLFLPQLSPDLLSSPWWRDM